MVSRVFSLKYQVIFCISESVALIIPYVANVFTKLSPSRGIWNPHTDKRRAKKNSIRKSNSNFWSVDFFVKRIKSVEKMIHQKKNRGHRTSKIVKSSQSYSNGHLPYHCSFYYLARIDAWRGMWICVRRKDKTINANVLKVAGLRHLNILLVITPRVALSNGLLVKFRKICIRALMAVHLSVEH